MPSTRSEQKVKKVTTKVTNTIIGPSRTCRRSSNKAAPTKTNMDFAFKAPPPIFKSPVETRSRRSSMFGISNSKGGIRLNIAITPQDKKFVPAREKALSPPGVATRTRRSSIYVKGGKLNSLLKESQMGENQFELASKKVLSPPGMIRRTRRSSIYVKGGKFTGLLQPEDKAKDDLLKDKMESPEPNKKGSSNKTTQGKEPMASPLPKASAPAAKISKSRDTKTNSTPPSLSPAITRSSRKRKPSNAGASTGKRVRNTPYSTRSSKKTPYSTRGSRKRPVSDTDLNVSLEILANTNNKIPKDDLDYVDLIQAKTPVELSQKLSSENMTKLQETPAGNSDKDMPEKVNHLTPIDLNVTVETDLKNEETSKQLPIDKKLQIDEAVKEDEENIKEGMKVHLKKKGKTPKVMIVSPALVTPVRPPRMKRRRATPSRIEPKNKQMEKSVVRSTDNVIINKDNHKEEDTVSIRSDAVNDLTVNTTSHSGRAAKCVIL